MKKLLLLLSVMMLIIACKDKNEMPCEEPSGGNDSSMPIGEDYDLEIPFYVSIPTLIPEDNPIKVPAVELGRHLFWDTRLSGNNTLSCASCHIPVHSFSDPDATSVGIDGINGTRNSMALVNLVFQPVIRWDGGAESLEQQAIDPVENVIEMHDDWDDVLVELDLDPLYPQLFEDAYGSTAVTKERASKAIASFIRSMVSFNAKYDRVVYGPESFTALEQLGFQLWGLEGGIGTDGGGDCFHCHALETQIFTDNEFRNNGLDSEFADLGRGGVTGIAAENGKFKTPGLRNIELSAPYMHDGRFQTLEDVIDHYNSGGVASATVDPNMEFIGGGLQLTDQKKAALVAFLKTFTDNSFIENPAFADPF